MQNDDRVGDIFQQPEVPACRSCQAVPHGSLTWLRNEECISGSRLIGVGVHLPREA